MARTDRLPLPHDKMKVDLPDPVPGSSEVEAFRPRDLLELQNPSIELLGPVEIGHIDLEVINSSALERTHALRLS
jgi:hypothetical protein